MAVRAVPIHQEMVEQSLDELCLERIRRGVKGAEAIADSIIAEVGPIGILALLEADIFNIVVDRARTAIFQHRSKAVNNSGKNENSDKSSNGTRQQKSRARKSDIWMAQWYIGHGPGLVRKTTAELTVADCLWLAQNKRRLAGIDLAWAEWHEQNAKLAKRKHVAKLGELRKLGVSLPALPAAQS
jgi:hypothetical protein